MIQDIVNRRNDNSLNAEATGFGGGIGRHGHEATRGGKWFFPTYGRIGLSADEKMSHVRCKSFPESMYNKVERNGECSEVIRTQQASVKSDGLADR